MHFWDQLHHPLQSMGSLPAKINKKTKCEWLWSSYKMYKTYQRKATKDKIYMENHTFSAHILLKSEIFFTWLSIKLCPPNPGFTDMIKTRSTTVNMLKLLVP